MNVHPSTHLAQKHYQQCTKTVMDTIADPNISFDQHGISSYYYDYLSMERQNVYSGEEGKKKIAEIVQKIKEAGRGKKYDCITGVSGGVDSTYLVLQAKKLGLNPLVVHFDNGWNSETAVNNIKNIISTLGFDLYTLVVNWDEFKDIQLSYFKANVVDIEAITDHAIAGTLYKLANKYDIKYILSGNNVVTEGILPRHWVFSKLDGKNIRDIYKKFGNGKMISYPLFSSASKFYSKRVKKIETICLLDYMPYDKKEAKSTIAEELNWKDYGGKHFESVFTRFYQAYILPNKFGIDKRKAHLSTLICSGQITKAEALKELEHPIYNPEQLEIDKKFVLKKLGLSELEFESYIKAPRREHTEFMYEKGIWEDVPYLKLLHPIWRTVKKIRSGALQHKTIYKKRINLATN